MLGGYQTHHNGAAGKHPSGHPSARLFFEELVAFDMTCRVADRRDRQAEDDRGRPTKSAEIAAQCGKDIHGYPTRQDSRDIAAFR